MFMGKVARAVSFPPGVLYSPVDPGSPETNDLILFSIPDMFDVFYECIGR
jgi:hypothetical protein